MDKTSIDKKMIESLLPHREPMLLIDKLINIVHLKSATAVVNVKKTHPATLFGPGNISEFQSQFMEKKVRNILIVTRKIIGFTSELFGR